MTSHRIKKIQGVGKASGENGVIKGGDSHPASVQRQGRGHPERGRCDIAAGAWSQEGDKTRKSSPKDKGGSRGGGILQWKANDEVNSTSTGVHDLKAAGQREMSLALTKNTVRQTRKVKDGPNVVEGLQGKVGSRGATWGVGGGVKSKRGKSRTEEKNDIYLGSIEKGGGKDQLTSIDCGNRSGNRGVKC